MFTATVYSNPFHYFTMPWFWSCFLAWMTAQTIKMIRALIKTKQLDFAFFLSTGGMPSAHSAMVTGLATSIGITEGFDTPIAMLALGFAAITMFDAAVVRRAAGQQAKIINRMVKELFTEHRITRQPLKELLGHTRLEVFFGMMTGIAVAAAVCALWKA